MNLGADPKHDLPGISLMELISDLGAGFEVIFHRLMEGFLQSVHCVGVKAHNIADAGDSSFEKMMIIIIVDTGGITFVDHGFTPTRYSVS